MRLPIDQKQEPGLSAADIEKFIQFLHNVDEWSAEETMGA